jgi:regulation of enolase protein 1 (concanavalin A-like superfamily)
MKRMTQFSLLLLLSLLAFGLVGPQVAEAGVFDADEEVTYKEYWVDHSEFTGSFVVVGGICIYDKPGGGSAFIEPGKLDTCPKDMDFTIPDDISQAEKVEMVVDLWRNYDIKSARIQFNGGTVYESEVGFDWSRTPWVVEVDKADIINQGTNTITIWGERPYHIKDLGFRVYYDNDSPLIPGAGSDVTPPDGELLTVTGDVGQPVFNAADGGRLIVNSDKVTLTASVTDAAYVEFHGYYDGYDEDNDGAFRDWHSRGRNNWWPGGTEEKATGGTIDHIGTKTVPGGNGNVSIEWDMPYIINQPGVKFKIRVVDAAGNVRETAGGVSGEFKLARNYPVIYYTIPDFDDFGLHMSGERPQDAQYTMVLPSAADLPLSSFFRTWLIGSYWKNPRFTWNDLPQTPVRAADGRDEWTIGIKDFAKNAVKNGNNNITYYYNGNGVGQFIEKPGPMLVLEGNNTVTPDTSKPTIKSRFPANGSVGASRIEPITIRMADTGSGVDWSTIIMSIDGVPVEPTITGTAIDYSISYLQQPSFEPSTTYTVTIFGCDLMGNCMNGADVFSFTTEAKDETPPVISNVLVNTLDTTADITWTTDEKTDTEFDYGLTQSYELPGVTDPTLVTSHKVSLTNLLPDTVYNFMLTATDFDGNTTSTDNLTFKTKAAPGEVLSDNFDDCQLDTEVWSFINPLNDATMTMTGQGIQIAVPAGTGHDIWKTGVNAPRVMQLVLDQDMQVEAKFNTAVTKKTQMQGILFQQDDTNWLRFTFQSDGSVTSVTAAQAKNGNSNATVLSSQPIVITAPLWLRVSRDGDTWTAEVSSDGLLWTPVVGFDLDLTVTKVGVFVGNTGSNPAFTAEIDYFVSASDPIAPGGDPVTLDVVVNGLGTVTKNPNKTNYTCNEAVTLTATPAPDWSFNGWGGDLTGFELVKQVVMDGSKDVIANFTNATPYNVDIVIDSQGVGDGGTVTKTPDKATYLYDDVVELEALPNLGWTFEGWSGDLVSPDATETLTVTQNYSITATFSQDQYVLSLGQINEGFGDGGDVAATPSQATYLYGTDVELLATPATGWTFAGWEGDITSSDNPLDLTMTSSISVSARFIQETYPLNIIINSTPVPGGSGPGGTVLKSPDQPEYGFGQVVTFTASPFGGWFFTGWGGALSGTAITETLEIQGETTIEANFQQETYSLEVNAVGEGTINVNPVKATYFYGDQVTLTAVPDQFYELKGWSGDLSGNGNPAIITIEKDTVITGTFGIDNTPIEITEYSVDVFPGGTSAKVNWKTDVPGTSRVDFGLDEFYTLGTVTDDDLVKDHGLIITGLSPDTLYHFQITSVDAFGNSVSTDDDTFSTRRGDGVVSDDFSACGNLNPALWEFINPLGTSSVQTNGTQVLINVPADVEHNAYQGKPFPRVMQQISDEDFTVDVKFESPLDAKLSMQGIVIEQDPQNYLTFSVYSRFPGEVVLYASGVVNGTGSALFTKPPKIAETAELWLRVERTGNEWKMWYSFDGQDWVVVNTKALEYDIVANKLGFFAGNAKQAGNIPAFTATVDYFFNQESPLTPEDARYPIQIGITGQGTVTRNPDRSGYYCGQEVTLTAKPKPGWVFGGWSGDITGTSSVRTIIVDGPMNIMALFRDDIGPGGFLNYLPIAVR